MSVNRLAARCDVDPKTISRLEHARVDPRIGTLTVIAAALDVDVADLLGGDGETRKARSPAAKRGFVELLTPREMSAMHQRLSERSLSQTYRYAPTDRPVDRVRAALAEHGCEPQGSPDRFVAFCPACDDRLRRLTVVEGVTGLAIVFCSADCPSRRVLDRLGLAYAADTFVGGEA